MNNVYTLSLGHVLQVGARCSSVVDRPLMVGLVVGSILHGGPIVLFLVATSDPVRGMCYPVRGMVHINDPILRVSSLAISVVLYHMSGAV